jgi:DNA repair protein RadD
MVPAATIEAIIARVCREGDLTKKALLAEWPEVRDTYPLMRSLVLRDQRVIAGLKGIGGFRATAAIADEVAKAASEEGFLSRRAACRRWRLNDRDYSKVGQEVLHHADIERGGGRGGGFRAALSTEPTVEDPDRDVTIDPGIALLDWQRAAVELIAEALQREQLRILVGPLAGTIRTAIRIREGMDRPSRKAELAAALVLRHGRDLLRVGPIREALSTARGLSAPQRWHPGKATALDFVEQLGLPIEFAGEPLPERKPDFEYFEPRQNHALRDFQSEVQLELLTEFNRSGGRAILTLPTGAGKTLVAVDTIREWLLKRPQHSSGHAVLWLAHTDELCEQAYQCFAEVWSGSSDVSAMYLFRFWAGYTVNMERHGDTLLNILEVPCVIISTPQRIINLIDDDDATAELILDAMRSELKLIMIDEAHRAAAPSYRRIVDFFVRDNQQHPALIGLTATPFPDNDAHSGAAQLRQIFEKIIEPTKSLRIDEGYEPIQILQERGILAQIRWQPVRTNVSLPLVADSDRTPFEDIDMQLSRHADKSIRRMKILDTLLPLCADNNNSILYFGPTVHDAEAMAYLLIECGVSASVVSGNTLQSTRRKSVAEFKNGRLRVLCNCEVLTTGFDAPRVTHIVVARPTVSLVLYQQMIGRGLRGPEFGGTDVCTILNCEDNYRGDLTLGYEAFREIWLRPHRAHPTSPVEPAGNGSALQRGLFQGVEVTSGPLPGCIENQVGVGAEALPK